MAGLELSLNLPWPTSSISSITSSLSSLYCLLTISVYVVITINKFTTSSLKDHAETEASNLLLYMLLTSCMFLIYLLVYLTRPPRSHSNKKSHGSAFLRQGAAVFGIGTCFYTLITLASHILNFNCVGPIRTINSCLSIVFITLQMMTIIVYPRLNLDLGYGVPHFGLMHLVATNLIIWIKTVIKESILEFNEAEEKNHEDDQVLDPSEHLNTNSSCTVTHIEEDDYMFAIVRGSSPILFAFIIEFALIGATVFYNMWLHVQPYSQANSKCSEKLPEKPNIKAVLSKTDWSHSSYGASTGLVIVLINIISLGVFFGVASDMDVIDEYIEKVTRSITNSYGIIATLIAIVQIQKLVDKTESEDTSVDAFLLNLGGSLSYVYMCFTITVGVFTTDIKDVPGGLHIINGFVDIVQVTLQIVLIKLLLHKVIKSQDDAHPGRQATAFLVLLNFTLWLVDTFELQKSQASLVESAFYGPITWVCLQRLTLPLAIFFRFHSTVVLIDCWKNSYRIEQIIDDAVD
eukprot:GFUD01016321.1.p1 GENE.GFUD01016321.1~~GFUD01016321.1.p1  ORF type:complete len:518 (+),score=114.00 GFUD01016321.1:44-1597(+)